MLELSHCLLIQLTAEHLVAAAAVRTWSPEYVELFGVFAVGDSCTPATFWNEAMLGYGGPSQSLKVKEHQIIETDFLLACSVWVGIAAGRGRRGELLFEILLVLVCTVIFTTVDEQVLIVADHDCGVISSGHWFYSCPLGYDRDLSLIKLGEIAVRLWSRFTSSLILKVLSNHFNQVIRGDQSTVFFLLETTKHVRDVVYYLITVS